MCTYTILFVVLKLQNKRSNTQIISENITYVLFIAYPKEQITENSFSYVIWMWSDILFAYKATLFFLFFICKSFN